MGALLHDPLSLPSPAEVPLPNAPLVRVIAQVRFPQILSIEKKEFVAPFQEAIRAHYPVLRAEQTQGLMLGPQGAVPMPPGMIWRFEDEHRTWRASLAPDFAAIETTGYESRKDFFDRLETILRALTEHVGPKTVDRIGVRYIDRVSGDAINDISKLVHNEVLGIVATPAGKHARHTITESVFAVPGSGAQLLARWGLLAKDATIDPAVIEPSPEPSWILDLDMFCTESRTFDATAIVSEARSYAERIYGFFRWAVTDDFLRSYGGSV